jgi:hypothetical protein
MQGCWSAMSQNYSYDPLQRMPSRLVLALTIRANPEMQSERTSKTFKSTRSGRFLWDFSVLLKGSAQPHLENYIVKRFWPSAVQINKHPFEGLKLSVWVSMIAQLKVQINKHPFEGLKLDDMGTRKTTTTLFKSTSIPLRD